MFYYAGHGAQYNGENYLIPIDADIEHEDEIQFEAISANFVLRKMEIAKTPINVIILDACRDNPFKRKYRSNSRGLVALEPPTSAIIAYATSPGETAEDGNGKNGVFTEVLLNHLGTPNLDIEMMFKNVRRDDYDITGGKQMPWTNSSLTKMFYFNENNTNPIESSIEIEKQNINQSTDPGKKASDIEEPIENKIQLPSKTTEMKKPISVYHHFGILQYLEYHIYNKREVLIGSF